MLADLATAIERFDIAPTGDDLVEALALRDRLDARIVEATGVFEANGCWAGDASVSFVAWLRAHAKMTRRAALRLRTLAVRLRSLPLCSQAYADGSLSGGQIEAIVARLDDEVVEIFAAQEAELVPYLIPMTVAGVSRAMGYWLARNRPEPSEPKEPERSLYLSPTLDDRWVLNGELDAEGGSVVATALRLATPDKTDLLTSPATRRANALVDICRFFLDHQQTYAGGRHRPHVNVIVELKDLEAGAGGQVVDGPALDGPTVARLFCDSAVHRVVMSGRSAILDYGTATRTIPAPLWNALVIRDEHCRFPGCDRPSLWCEGHHVVWVTQGGPTELANLVLLCSRHHHVLHQPGWHAKLRPDGEFEVTDPEGIVRETSRHGRNRSGDQGPSDSNGATTTGQSAGKHPFRRSDSARDHRGSGGSLTDQPPLGGDTHERRAVHSLVCGWSRHGTVFAGGGRCPSGATRGPRGASPGRRGLRDPGAAFRGAGDDHR